MTSEQLTARGIRQQIRSIKTQIQYCRLEIQHIKKVRMPEVLKPWRELRRQIKTRKDEIRLAKAQILQLQRALPKKPITLKERVADSLGQVRRCDTCHRIVPQRWACWRNERNNPSAHYCGRCASALYRPLQGYTGHRHLAGWVNVHHRKHNDAE